MNGIIITDTRNNILSVNRAFTEITGYTEDEVLGKNPHILNSGRQGPAFYQELWESLALRGRWQGEVWNRRKDGALYAEWLSISAVCNEQGDVTHHVAIFSDITERLLAADQVRRLAYHDPLTGLPNRALLYDRISQLLLQARREQHPVAVLFVDLDYFKDVNDLFGYAVGDLLLQAVAERLQNCVREADTVARLGGDEFVVVSAVQQARDVVGVAQKIAA
ncbi:MAG: diguanylate cyclase, partial [Gammaproteobacteria bacterium]|nr:diguanylate cyclase [Gammaproteobacteria bacterium]